MVRLYVDLGGLILRQHNLLYLLQKSQAVAQLKIVIAFKIQFFQLYVIIRS